MPKEYTRRNFIKISAASALGASSFMHLSCGLFPDFDVIIVGGTIFDGSGRPRVKSDLGIRDGVITAMGELKDRSARKKIEADGLAVAPGFIDFHSHSDDELLLGGEAQSKIRQGVTTEVLGQDGESMAPLNPKMKERMMERLKNRYEIETDWDDFAGYLRTLEERGMITNAASMVGQGTLWEYVVGEDDRPATPEEIEKMKNLAKVAFSQGAYGISSGLEYTPGSFASTEEITEICRSMEGHGIYSTHMRNEDDTVIEALQEAIQIAHGSGVALNISHIKASAKRNWHKLLDILRLLNEARASGMQVTCDRYPYIAYNTDLSALFPLWSRDGGSEKFVARLQDPSLAHRLRADVMAKIEKLGGWHAVMVSSIPDNPNRGQYEGKNFEELSRDGTDPYSLLAELIIQENGGGSMVGFAMSEENTAKILSYPYCMIASDASSLAVEGKLRKGNPHPRSFGTFPRVLGKYARDEELMKMEEAIRKMTFLPAETLGLKDRGYLKKGLIADVAVFDPNSVIDNATWSEPHQYPSGIPYVLVNGKLVIDQEKFTGQLAGKVLRIS